jgi:hypothetical protein
MKYNNNENVEESHEINLEMIKLKYHLIKIMNIIVENIVKNNYNDEIMLHLQVKCFIYK